MSVKLLRTLRLDASDGFVFEHAANPGEWAIPGSFMFLDQDVSALAGKKRQAFRSGFLGLTSFGWSTLAMVSEESDEEREVALSQLAGYLMAEHGAPDHMSALAAAREEIAFMESLAQHPPQTIIALNRRWRDGEVSEQFRTLRPAEQSTKEGMPCSAGAFFVEEEAAEEAEGNGLPDLMQLRQMVTKDLR